MKQRQQFKRLFEPVRIGQMELKNRIVMLPMENNYATEDGSVTERLKNYYRERAREVGLVGIQITCIDSPVGKGYVYQLCIHDDALIPGLSELVQTIHDSGAKVYIQLHHAGANARGQDIVAASPLPLLPSSVIPKELTVSEIKDIILHYVTAAERAKKAGFDAVEVVASGNYLVWNFLSPTWNKRRDEYGGDLRGRARLFIEIIHAIKAKVGESYPVTCRLAIGEYGVEGGLTVKEAQQVVQMARDASLDGVTTTAIGDGSTVPDYPGALLSLSTAIKQVVTLPVTTAGRMDLEVGERALKEGKADLVGIGRRLLADPGYVAKAASGRFDEITPCIACMVCIETSLLRNVPLRCAVNPACGLENEYKLIPANKPKRVMVVGGGPAGMEAAIVAAQRGHQVTLYEKEPRLGRQLIVAAIPPNKDKIGSLTTHLTTQVRKVGVKVELGKEVSRATVEAAKPDTLVLATGIENIIPDILNIDEANVAFAEDVLTGRVEVGIEVAIIGGNLVGCETAEFLVNRGMKVTIVEILDRLATKMNPLLAMRLLDRLTKRGVIIVTGVKHEEYKDNTLVITTKEGAEKTIRADTVILAAGSRPNTKLLQTLEGLTSEIHSVGDCVEPRNFTEAIAEAFNIGRTI